MDNWMFSFVDILGFASEVKAISSEEDMKKVKSKITDFVSNFAVDAELNPDDANSDCISENGIFVKSFSDSVLRVKRLPEDVTDSINSEFEALIKATNWCIQEGYLIRGGVTIGRHFDGYSKIPGDRFVPIMISPALIEAYKIETTIAKYPRIVLSEKVIEHLNQKNQEFLYWYRNVASIDYLWFDFIENGDSNSDVIVKHANSAISTAKSKAIREKYQWLKNYHNKTMERIFQESKIEDGEVAYKIQREWYSFI